MYRVYLDQSNDSSYMAISLFENSADINLIPKLHDNSLIRIKI